MSFETEAVLDRRSLRRRLGLWRGLAIAAGLLALAGIASRVLPDSGLGGGRQIARVTIEGLITEDRDQLRMLQEIAKARRVEAVLVFVNSGGGTTTGGEALFEALRQISKEKPVVAQFGTVAASAAYIAGLATDHMVARGNTITGSVGVIFQYPEVSELMAKAGIKMHEIKSGPLKATPSMFQPIDEGGRKVAEQIVAEGQRWFLGLVTERRGIQPADVPGLEQGRIYSGREAVGYKLVDEIGGEDAALRWLQEKRGIDPKLRLIDWKPARTGDWSLLRLVTGGLARLLGGGDTAGLPAVADKMLGRLTLDGLVSIWHPGER